MFWLTDSLLSYESLFCVTMHNAWAAEGGAASRAAAVARGTA